MRATERSSHFLFTPEAIILSLEPDSTYGDGPHRYTRALIEDGNAHSLHDGDQRLSREEDLARPKGAGMGMLRISTTPPQ